MSIPFGECAAAGWRVSALQRWAIFNGLLPIKEDRVVERFQQRTGRRAEQKLLQPALPVGAHDQKVRVGVGCRLENPVGDGVAFIAIGMGSTEWPRA